MRQSVKERQNRMENLIQGAYQPLVKSIHSITSDWISGPFHKPRIPSQLIIYKQSETNKNRNFPTPPPRVFPRKPSNLKICQRKAFIGIGYVRLEIFITHKLWEAWTSVLEKKIRIQRNKPHEHSQAFPDKQRFLRSREYIIGTYIFKQANRGSHSQCALRSALTKKRLMVLKLKNVFWYSKNSPPSPSPFQAQKRCGGPRFQLFRSPGLPVFISPTPPAAKYRRFDFKITRNSPSTDSFRFWNRRHGLVIFNQISFQTLCGTFGSWTMLLNQKLAQ